MLQKLSRVTPPAQRTIDNICKHVLQNLQRAKQNTAKGHPWIGLAISGGVDSMALAAVCSDIQSRHAEFASAFKAFIVDHGVREGSGEEAANVAAELEKLGIKTYILKLDWEGKDPKALSNFESVARRLRYRALGTACWKSRINKLLLAHHFDDQSETVLSRTLTGYLGTGLNGVKRRARLPECEGLFGVDASGWREFNDAAAGQVLTSSSDYRKRSRGMGIEGGGVHVYRPLLPFRKDGLISLCQAKGIRWFEDQTNNDKTLTLRNTIRYLTRAGLLPEALQSHRMAKLAKASRDKRSKLEDAANRLFREIPLVLDVRTGQVVIRMPRLGPILTTAGVSDLSEPEAYHMKAEVLRRWLLMVSPSQFISLQDLDQAMDLAFAGTYPASSESVVASPKKVQVAKVDIERQGSADDDDCDYLLSLSRVNPTRDHAQAALELKWTDRDVMEAQVERWEESRTNFPNPEMDRSISGTTNQTSDWTLWDSRFWIRYTSTVESPGAAAVSYTVRFLTPTLLGALRKSLDQGESLRRGKLDRRLAAAPGRVRWTIPAVVAAWNGEERVMSLPSISWYDDTWAGHRADHRPDSPTTRAHHTEIRYKNVDLGPKQKVIR